MSRPRLGTLKPAVGRLDTRTAHLPPKVADPHYNSAEHDAWRSVVIGRAGGQCEWIEDGRRCDRAQPHHRMFADHIKERSDGGADVDLANGQCLCGKHHTIKTNLERMKRTAIPA